MKKLLLSLSVSFLIAVPFAAAQVNLDALPLLLKDFDIHDFDNDIPNLLGYDNASVVYFQDMGSISPYEKAVRDDYDPIGCFPFYVMKDGKVAELGFNCRSFFCVGYQKGPKQCRDRFGEVTGGVAEITKRISTPPEKDAVVPFEKFAVSVRTPAMQKAIDDLTPIRCTPHYMMHFDVAVGEGYNCEEVGKYPYYSPKNSCTDDWRNEDGLSCTFEQRPDERERRMQALNVRSSFVPPPPMVMQAIASGSTVEMQTATGIVLRPKAPFPDVQEGKYGYTAIAMLAAKGVIKGYPDSTFRPMLTISRAEFTKIFMQGLYGSEVTTETDCFKDVRDQWFSAPVCAGKRLGWINGFEDGTFRPQKSVTMAEAITLIVASLPNADMNAEVTLPSSVQEESWYTPSVRAALAAGILREPIFEPNRELTRADAAVWIYRAAGLMSGE